MSAAQASDGGYVVLAKEYYEGPCSFGIRLEPEDCAQTRVYTKLLKLDREGEVEWVWRQELENRSALEVAELAAGTYIVRGWSAQDVSNNVIWLAAFDGDGDKIWEMADDQPSALMIPVVMERANPSSLIVLTGYYDEDMGYCVYSFSIHADGTVTGRLVTPLPSSAAGLPMDFAYLTDGGYLAAVERGDSIGALAKFNADGTLQWSRTFSREEGGLTRSLQVRGMPDGNIAATFGAWDSEAKLMEKYDADGSLQWIFESAR